MKKYLSEQQELLQVNKCCNFSVGSLIKNNIFNLYLHDANTNIGYFALSE
jgi:hypothetical protein